MKSKSELEPIIDRWCDALESGAYEQGRCVLNQGNRFCCLGVLCDILKNDFELVVERKGMDRMSYNGALDRLPADIAEGLGISSSGEFRDEDGCLVNVDFSAVSTNTLADANDAGVRFPRIAAVIRANKHLLFKAYREGDAQ